MGMRIKLRSVSTIALVGAALLAGPALTAAAAADPGRDRAVTIRLAAAGINPNALAPGWTVRGNQIVWDRGAVMASIGPASADDCDPGYVCVWEHKEYRGRRLQFRDAGMRGNMHDYDFNDKMSSWRNRNNKDARWYWDTSGNGKSRCMNSGSRNPDVGKGLTNRDNDEMSSLRIYPNASAC